MQNSDFNKEQKLYDDYEDALFRLAMHKVAEQDGKFFGKEMQQADIDEAEYLPSKESEEKFIKLLNAELKKNKKETKGKRQYLKKTLTILVAIIALFSIGLLTVDAFRVQVYNFLLSIKDEYTLFQLQDNGGGQNSSQMIVDWKNAYAPTYMPDGYEITDIYNTSDVKTITFKNKQDDILDITYTELASSTALELDTESASLVKTISINGNKGTLISKDKIITVAWIMDNKMFCVSGQVDQFIIIKIAESVKFIK